MQFAILALAAFLGLQVAVEQTNAWKAFDRHAVPDSDSVKDFDEINHMLVENVPDDDIEANMAMIKETYEKKSSEGDNSFVAALGKLAELDSILNMNKCDRETYDLLRALDLGTSGKSRSWVPFRRIDKIVKHYTKEHAWICYNVFPRLVNATKVSVSEESLKYLVEMARYVVAGFDGDNCKLLEPEHQDSLFHLFPIRHIIEELAEEDPELKSAYLVIDEETGVVEADAAKVKGLYNKYFYEPCKEFNDKVGDKYFDLIKYDFEYRVDVGYEPSCSNIYLDAIAMNVCNQLMHDKDFEEFSVNSLMKSSR